MLDEGGFGVALQSENGILDARALLLAFARDIVCIRECLRVVAQAQLKQGATLPDW